MDLLKGKMPSSFILGESISIPEKRQLSEAANAMTISMEDTPWPRDEAVADKRLGAEQLKILALASLGSILEFLEYNVFIFLSPIIASLFFPPDIPPTIRTIQVMSVFAIGYLGRPIGGVLLGILGDRFGRKRTFGLSVLLIAAATLSIGLLPVGACGTKAPLSSSSHNQPIRRTCHEAIRRAGCLAKRNRGVRGRRDWAIDLRGKG
jgi:Sugar (and other) transporter